MSNRKPHYLHSNQPLGALGKVAERNIEQNSGLVQLLISKQKEQKQYKEGDTLSFDEIDKLYNAALTFEEKQAWVWFKRSQGIPMKGWEKYFLKQEKSSNTAKVSIRTNKQTVIKDNHFRDIATVPKGVIVGYPTRFENKYDKVVYLVFTTDQGYKQYVNKADVDFIGEGENQEVINGQIKSLVKSGALFFSNGLYLPYALFAFGNMYDREFTLNKDANFIKETFGEDVYQTHFEVIQKSKPKFLSVQVVDQRERPIILAISPLAKDVDLFRISEFRDDSGIDLQKTLKGANWQWKPYSDYSTREKDSLKTTWFSNDDELYKLPLREAFKFWLYEQPEDVFTEVSAYYIEKYYLDRDKFSNKVSDEEKDTINKYAPQLGEELFAKFLHEALTFEDTEILDKKFNRMYNGFADVAYNKVPIGFVCSAFFKQSLLSFSEAQKESIAFMEVATAGLLAYDVGVGKTMSAIITLANAIQQGKCKRPLIVVPNQTYRKWIKELFGYENKKTKEKGYGVLSGTGITLNDFYNLGAEVVTSDAKGDLKADGKSLMTLLPENSISMVTYEGLKKLGINKGLDESFQEMYDILQQNDRNFKSVRDQVKYQESLEEALSKVNKGSIVDFNTLGIDYLVIDEAHACKNIFEAVKSDEEGKVRYQLGSASSELGIKAFFFCNSIIRKFGGNVLLLTATPFTNSPIEIYAMLSLVGYKTMKDMNLSNLNTFMCNFVKQSLEYVNKVDGTIAMDYVVKAYTNRQVLQKLIYSHIIYKTGEDAGVKRPVKINLPRLKKVDSDGRVISLKREEQILTYLQPNLIQIDNQKQIEASLTFVTSAIGNKNSKVSLGDIGRLLNQNLDNALSPYLMEKEFPDHVSFVENSPKIEYVLQCIRSVKNWHDERKQECSGQVIYCNRAKEYFPLIQRYLNSEIGFKTEVKFEGASFNEVEIINSSVSINRKERIKEAFLAGVVKVLIGTSSIREGIDLQKRGTCLYILTPDWNPTDMKQVEGRIWRQGNEFGYVRIVIPLLQDSMDIFVFQKLEEKTARVNDIWYKAGRGNVLDQEALDPEEIKLALFSKIDVLVKLKLELLNKDLKRKLTLNKLSQEALVTFKARYSNYLATRINVMKSLELVNTKLPLWVEVFEKQSKNEQSSADFKKKGKEQLERTTELLEDLSLFLIATSQDDKELLKLCRRLQSYLTSINQQSAEFNNYVENLKVLISFVRKTERTMLAPRGYSPSDTERLIQELVEEQKLYAQRVSFLETKEGLAEVKKEIEEAKEKYSVSGKMPDERAKEFAQLNYLLGYDANSKNTEPEQASDKELSQQQRIRVALALAKARARMRARNQ